MEQNINVLKQNEMEVTIVEEKKYTAAVTIQNQLYNIQHQKAILIEQSKVIKQQFDDLTLQEEKFKEVLAHWEKDDLTEVIELEV